MSALGKKKRGEPPPPTVIIQRRGGHPSEHGGAWKVAYGDFVTTMMALFIVLWASSQSQDVRHAIAQYFRHPAVLTTSGVGATLLPEPPEAVSVPQPTPAPNEEDPAIFRKAQDALLELLDKDPALQALREQVLIQITPEGLRIQLVEREGKLLFEIGSATVKPALIRLLGAVAVVARPLPNKVAVEGHTDARRYTREPYSNWELSADRANAARRVLETAGLERGHITRVVGHADTDQLVPDPLDAQNRRVSVILLRRGLTPVEGPALTYPAADGVPGPDPGPVPAPSAAPRAS